MPARRNIGTTPKPPRASPRCSAPNAAKPPKPPAVTTAPSGTSAMSNNNGSSHSAPVDDLVREGRRIQQLVAKIEDFPDDHARELLGETLETVLRFYGLGL